MKIGWLAGMRYVARWITGPEGLGRAPALPRILSLPITDNCNSRCLMCDLWKERSEGEMTASDYRAALSDELFRAVAHVGISGGEPSLRKDLPELVRAIVESLPRLKTLSITTHGFLPRIWSLMLEPIAAACRGRAVALTLNLSLDGIEDVHDRVRGIPGGYRRLVATREVARQTGVRVQFQATVLRTNIHHMGRLREWAEARKEEIVFRQATTIERLRNRESIEAVRLDAGQASFLADFLSSAALERSTRSPARRLFYRDLARRLARGGDRRAPCAFQSEGALLDPKGRLFHCSIAERALGDATKRSAHSIYFSPEARDARLDLVRDVCPGCVHDQNGSWSPLALAVEQIRLSAPGRWIRRSADAAHLGLRLGKAVLASTTAARGSGSGDRPGVGSRPSALVVGAYGGEHVGDAAILGGVLLRLAARGVTAARVASFRPDRSRRWLESLRPAIATTVVDVADPDLGADLEPDDLLVHAGGPVMDLPRILTRELEIVTKARRRGARFVLEGVGVGPFRRATSRLLARRLFVCADEVRVRTETDSRSPLLRRVERSVTDDPAFDYLRWRLSSVDAIQPADAEGEALALMDREVEPEASDTNRSCRPVRIALNLRPIWDRYLGSSAISARELGIQLRGALVNAMERLTLAEPKWRIQWVLFAMNADQFGFSDFEPAWELIDVVSGRFDVRLVEHELGVESVLALLLRSDALVAMRLHASIFGFSVGLPCIGIDYAAGEKGKVSALFARRGVESDCISVDQLTGEWLVDRVQRAVSAPRSAAVPAQVAVDTPSIASSS